MSFFLLTGASGRGRKEKGGVGEIAKKERGWEEFAKYFLVLFSALGMYVRLYLRMICTLSSKPTMLPPKHLHV